VFSHVIRGRPGGLLEFSGGGAIWIILSLDHCCEFIQCFATVGWVTVSSVDVCMGTWCSGE